MSDFYVYVYIDPRNFEEFYFGKGRGSRKKAHLHDAADTKKTRRIAAIRNAGLSPIIRVIAKGLSEREALIVEKTLLWKLGRNLTNDSSGHFADKFRPHDTLHKELPGFDYARGIYYYNVGEGPHRHWDDYRELGFISGGQGPRYRDAMRSFCEGDIIAAHLKSYGYVGIGRVLRPARPIREVRLKGRPLLKHKLRCDDAGANAECDENCEYVAEVKWAVAVERERAKWKANNGLFTTPIIRARLNGQEKTIRFLEREFNVTLAKLLT